MASSRPLAAVTGASTGVADEGKKDDPAQVAAQGFDALMQGKFKKMGGGSMPKAPAAARAFPDQVKAAAHRLGVEPGSAN